MNMISQMYVVYRNIIRHNILKNAENIHWIKTFHFTEDHPEGKICFLASHGGHYTGVAFKIGSYGYEIMATSDPDIKASHNVVAA